VTEKGLIGFAARKSGGREILIAVKVIESNRRRGRVRGVEVVGIREAGDRLADVMEVANR
jgi:hypothetical protein